MGATAINSRMRGWNYKNGENDRGQQAANNDPGQRCVRFASRLQFQSHGQKSHDRGQRSHEDRLRADSARDRHCSAVENLRQALREF